MGHGDTNNGEPRIINKQSIHWLGKQFLILNVCIHSKIAHALHNAHRNRTTPLACYEIEICLQG